MAFEGLSEKFSQVFKKLRSKGKLNEADVKQAMREVKLALLEADVNYKVVKDFVSKLTERVVGTDVLDSLTPAQQVIKIVNEELCALMGSEGQLVHFPSKPPCVIMMCGLQGSGKTTHSAKIAKYFKQQQHRRPLLVACDVYRPAAIKQLQIIGEQAGVHVYEEGNKDPVEIAKNAIKYAKDYGNDLVILDTAGRLHIDDELMTELQNMQAAVNPSEVLLVVDAMTGQDAVNVAKSFDEKLGINGVVLTKLDGDTRGGAALSVLAVTGKPVKFVGVGEKIDDLELFHPERMASRILGMGDMLTFIEKAENAFEDEKVEKLSQKFKKNMFDFNLFLDQIQQFKKMGSMRDVVDMVPGIGAKVKDEDIDENRLVKFEAIILSMTQAERDKPSLINPSRKKRIAAGSGTSVPEVNQILKQVESVKKLMKYYNSKDKRGRRRRKLPGMDELAKMGLFN